MQDVGEHMVGFFFNLDFEGEGLILVLGMKS